MKGTLISSDFVKDSLGNYRFIEINTDTKPTIDFLQNHSDFSELINLLSTSNIDTVEIVYKDKLHTNFVNYLKAELSASAPFVTSVVDHIEDIDSIYPVVPEDGDNKFILRCAYDENAILDSLYCKNGVNPLLVLSDNGKSEDAISYYYSSSEEFNDTLERFTHTNQPLPDLVQKHVFDTRQSVGFLKLPAYESGSQFYISSEYDLNRIDSFIDSKADSNVYYSNFHIHSSSIEDGVCQSVRIYSIVYGSSLSSLHLGGHNVQSLFGLPTELDWDGVGVKNLNDKHYYEFSTSTLKTPGIVEKDGVFETEKFVSASGELLGIDTIKSGSVMKSYHIDGMPDTDDPNVYYQWSLSGDSLPSGSYATSSVVVSVTTSSLDDSLLSEIKIQDETEYRYFHTSIALLVHESSSNEIKFVSVQGLDKNDHSIFNEDGNKVSLEETNIVLLNNPTGSIYSVDIEPSDILLTDGVALTTVGLFIHNLNCFVKGSLISLSNGDVKAIEDIVEGDEVLSYNEVTKTIEPNIVLSLNSPIHDDLVKYTLSNGTEIISTFDHPYYVKDKDLASYKHGKTNTSYDFGDRLIKRIEVGDVLFDINLNEVSIVSIEELPAEKTQTYIFHVENNENFFCNGILVHNKTPKV